MTGSFKLNFEIRSFLLLFSRPNITKVDILTFYNFLTTQSQKSSAKIALFIDNFIQNSVNFDGLRNDWNQLEEYVTINKIFVFKSSTYFFRMLITTIDILITNGILKYLIDCHYQMDRMSRKIEYGSKILDFWDLIYSFKIFIGLCLMSIVAFIIELKKPAEYVPDHKLKFAKIHPTNDDEIKDHSQLNQKLINHFKIKHSSQEESVSIQPSVPELHLNFMISMT